MLRGMYNSSSSLTYCNCSVVLLPWTISTRRWKTFGGSRTFPSNVKSYTWFVLLGSYFKIKLCNIRSCTVTFAAHSRNYWGLAGSRKMLPQNQTAVTFLNFVWVSTWAVPRYANPSTKHILISDHPLMFLPNYHGAFTEKISQMETKYFTTTRGSILH